MTPEAKIKKLLKQGLDVLPNLYYYMPSSGRYGRVGTPDFFICYKGFFISVETKRSDGKGVLSKMQEITLEKIKKAGSIALVVSNQEELENFLKKINNL